MRIAILVLVVSTACGKKSTGDWQRSREEYCRSLHGLHARIESRIDGAAKRLDGVEHYVEDYVAHETDNPEVRGAGARQLECARIESEIQQLGATLDGFFEGVGPLVMGRGNQSIEAAGLADHFGAEPIRMAHLDGCFHGDAKKDVAAIQTAKAKALKEIDDAIASCRAIGLGMK